MAPPQYSQRPEASGVVVAPQKGHVRATLGAEAAAAASRVVSPKFGERGSNFVRLSLGLAIFDRIALLDARPIHLERDAVVIRHIHVDGEIHVVIDVVTRRIVIVLFAVGIFPMQLGTRLTNLGIAAGDLRKIEARRGSPRASASCASR